MYMLKLFVLLLSIFSLPITSFGQYLPDELQTTTGILNIEKDHHENVIKLNGTAIHKDMENLNIGFMKQIKLGGVDVILLWENIGGSGTLPTYRFITVRPDGSYSITKSFGYGKEPTVFQYDTRIIVNFSPQIARFTGNIITPSETFVYKKERVNVISSLSQETPTEELIINYIVGKILFSTLESGSYMRQYTKDIKVNKFQITQSFFKKSSDGRNYYCVEVNFFISYMFNHGTGGPPPQGWVYETKKGEIEKFTFLKMGEEWHGGEGWVQD